MKKANMTMIYSPDPLRQQVEKQSNGQRTIIYSPKGQPNYVFIVPRFNLEDIDKRLGNGSTLHLLSITILLMPFSILATPPAYMMAN
ncbi:hypothetical protein AB6G58_01800 [Providencia huaxiensis]